MFPHMVTFVTFSMSETQDKEVPSSTSGAVKARRSCWVTYSSVKEMLPDGMSRRDQGEMMKPMAEGSAKRERNYSLSAGGNNLEEKQHIWTSIIEKS